MTVVMLDAIFDLVWPPFNVEVPDKTEMLDMEAGSLVTEKAVGIPAESKELGVDENGVIWLTSEGVTGGRSDELLGPGPCRPPPLKVVKKVLSNTGAPGGRSCAGIGTSGISSSPLKAT